MQSWNAYAKIVTALFVIANPVGVIPTFIIDPCISNGRTPPIESGHPEPVEGCTVPVMVRQAHHDRLGFPLDMQESIV
jgi:hypothetical protein